jgi:hypothetical protein
MSFSIIFMFNFYAFSIFDVYFYSFITNISVFFDIDSDTLPLLFSIYSTQFLFLKPENTISIFYNLLFFLLSVFYFIFYGIFDGISKGILFINYIKSSNPSTNFFAVFLLNPSKFIMSFIILSSSSSYIIFG